MFLSTYGLHCQRKGVNPINIFRPTIPFFHDETIIRPIQIRQDTTDDKNLDQVSAKKFQKDYVERPDVSK